jgi:DNA-binding NtrC family response regulator
MPLRGQRILLVEDEYLIALDLMTVITEAHAEVLHAATLPKAMELADTPGLSLALLDFRLGSEVSLPISAKLCSLGVPFIFHTGCGIPEVCHAWPRAAALSKPADAARIIDKLVEAAERGSGPCGSRGAWRQGEACALRNATDSCPWASHRPDDGKKMGGYSNDIDGQSRSAGE